MDYEKLTAAIKLCGSEPLVRRCEKECFYYKGGDTKKCIPRMTADAATAITDLLARAEAAEARVRELETSFRTEKCENGPECVELGRARKRMEEAEVRAEKAERERDAAVEQLHGICSACVHYTPYHNDGLCATCTHEVACFVPEKATDKWEWNGGGRKE